ncbi:carboxylating nicotinate-nucleotide diphosphorylase [Pseudomethylobacillus aquaticus]|uniref:Probable nicotinate-nucleotide pyrophosphorylase [carboxylating] n=1 Tax=Pseudomethylobacillus aquaticus TaxID=2676064 RepID=A0A3N0V3F8_9PROT|nr:carboxylating nicotinate-nucleotide diphosphorylase [Pseudomethylobacillus aquaticus]ROH87263.1 carboxylating nicotinate-nucleotide diphosphorylase [Pseudomethylobacillus aquaticus]
MLLASSPFNTDPRLNAALLADIDRSVHHALHEDLGTGDLTARLVPADKSVQAHIVCRDTAVLCGSSWVERCLQLGAADVNLTWQVQEGDTMQPGQTICTLHGNARALLTTERCMLNFLQTLSATATQTRRHVDAIAGTRARILDTRKTLPGLRLAQKYAVTVGGGDNQRLALYDGILIKENHIAAAGSIAAALQAAHALGAGVSIQIEVESLQELEAVLAAGAASVLLDNFDLDLLCKAVQLNAGRALLEASGGVDLDHLRAIAETGVDRISIGALTKHVQAVDFSMRFA